MSIILRNPAREVMEMMDRMFEDSLAQWSTQESGTHTARLALDAYSTDNEIVVVAAIPGVNPDDVEITVEGDKLVIRGEVPARLDNVHYVIAERFHGPFSRTLQLNVPVDVKNIKATFENGVLTLVLPKAEEIKPKVIKVKAK